MDDTPNGREYELDLGGERTCWLDEVCVSCGAVDGHRSGCEFAERSPGCHRLGGEDRDDLQRHRDRSPGPDE
jgi:hypothetical protein